MSIDTLMDEMQPVNLENKRLDYQEKSKSSALSSYCGSERFRRNVSQKITIA